MPPGLRPAVFRARRSSRGGSCSALDLADLPRPSASSASLSATAVPISVAVPTTRTRTSDDDRADDGSALYHGRSAPGGGASLSPLVLAGQTASVRGGSAEMLGGIQPRDCPSSHDHRGSSSTRKFQ